MPMSAAAIAAPAMITPVRERFFASYAGSITDAIGDGVTAMPSRNAAHRALCGRSAGRFSRQLHHQRRERRRQTIGRRAADRLGRFRHVRREQVDCGAASREGRLSREQLVRQHAERVDVRAMIHRGSAAACSGAMYAGVPSATPCECRQRAPGSPLLADCNALATPKSVTIASPPESSTLSGLMSRWTIPRSCA